MSASDIKDKKNIQEARKRIEQVSNIINLPIIYKLLIITAFGKSIKFLHLFYFLFLRILSERGNFSFT